MISGDSMESRIVKVQHGECNEVISNQGYESKGRSNRTTWK